LESLFFSLYSAGLNGQKIFKIFYSAFQNENSKTAALEQKANKSTKKLIKLSRTSGKLHEILMPKPIPSCI